MNINMKQIKNLIQHGKLTEISELTDIPYRTLQNWRSGANKWLEDTENKLTALQKAVRHAGAKYLHDELRSYENRRTDELFNKFDDHPHMKRTKHIQVLEKDGFGTLEFFIISEDVAFNDDGSKFRQLNMSRMFEKTADEVEEAGGLKKLMEELNEKHRVGVTREYRD